MMKWLPHHYRPIPLRPWASHADITALLCLRMNEHTQIHHRTSTAIQASEAVTRRGLLWSERCWLACALHSSPSSATISGFGEQSLQDWGKRCTRHTSYPTRAKEDQARHRRTQFTATCCSIQDQKKKKKGRKQRKRKGMPNRSHL